ncbi:uncharacterized protein LOC122663275 [Telopea speciosissima]|uniref:uncharacterized protein LOC122663275 n=1 Tax=Telopea speciosissima TaxID=54955 RepID=UPI001CC5C908|nr:uncharacterized protein LOC122663275 [Telopea speciosissima]
MTSSSVSKDELTLTVRWCGKEYTLRVCTNDTVGELKRRICQATSVLPKNQKLRYPKVGSKLSDDSLLLSKLPLKSSLKMTMIGTVEDDVIGDPMDAPEKVDDSESCEDEAVDIKGKEVKKQKSRCRSDQVKVPSRTSIRAGRNRVHPRGEMQSQSVAVEHPSCVQQSDPAPTTSSGPQLRQDNPDSNASMDGMGSDFAPSTIRRRGRGRGRGRGTTRGLKIASMPPGQEVQISVNQATVPARTSIRTGRNQVHPRGEMQSRSVAVEQPSCVQQSGPVLTTSSGPQLTQDNPDSNASINGMDSDFAPSTIRRRGRGPAKGHKIASMPPGQKVEILMDEYGQPCGEETSQLMTWIGTIARNTLLLPCNYTDWRKVPKQYKEAAWNKLKEKFNLNDEFKMWAIRKINDRWRDFKCHLKDNIYDRYSTYEDRVQHRDERVPVEQWLDLLRMWDSEHFKAMCERNKTNRSKQHTCHTAGKRSFAQLRERKRKEHPDGVPPSRLELFIDTHTRMDGSPIDIASGEKMAQMLSRLNERPEETRGDKAVHEEIFTEVMGDDTHGWGHLSGAGICLRDYKTSRKYAAYYWENAELRSEVEALNAKISSMQSQFNTLMQLVMSKEVGTQNKEVSNHEDRSSHM